MEGDGQTDRLMRAGRTIMEGTAREVVQHAGPLGCAMNMREAERLLVRDGTMSFSRPTRNPKVWVAQLIE